MIAEKTITDTIKLLKECGKGVKIAVNSIDEVLDTIDSQELKSLLEISKAEHEKTGLVIDALLAKHGETEEKPPVMAQLMSWTKINMKIAADKRDFKVAELMSQGCSVGIRSLCKYKNIYRSADKEAIDVADSIIRIEDELVLKLRKFL